MFRHWRKEMLSHAEGKVLEVGIGTGKNIPYYPSEAELTGIDFSEKMLSKAKKKYGQKEVNLLLMDIQDMSFDDDTFDTVVASCVFCSVPDPVQGLREIRRVCRDGGKILMLEHMRSMNKIIGPLMDVANPVPLYLYGANINRRTMDNLVKAGFSEKDMQVKNVWHDIVKLIEINNVKS
jgi:ubiquinone/menaquinone biosynthesis C-methylase UbiE